MTASNRSDPVACIPVACINGARASVAELRAALMEASPDRLLACLPALTEAAGRLGIAERILGNDGESAAEDAPSSNIGDARAAADAIRALRLELGGVARLIEQGASFYRGWARLLGAAAAGYTPSGEAAPLAARGSIALEG